MNYNNKFSDLNHQKNKQEGGRLREPWIHIYKKISRLKKQRERKRKAFDDSNLGLANAADSPRTAKWRCCS